MTFIAPAKRAHLRLPVTFRWTINGFTPGQPDKGATASGSFAVFIDRAPVQPGQSLQALAKNDLACHRTPGCPNAAYLAARQVYTTTDEFLLLDHIDDLPKTHQREQLHELTVVLLDSSGRRIHESAWYREFWLPRAGLR